jgi:hypothetical protein
MYLSVFVVDFLDNAVETSSFKPIVGWKAHNGEVAGVQFSYDETALFTIGTDNKVWKMRPVRSVLTTIVVLELNTSNI